MTTMRKVGIVLVILAAILVLSIGILIGFYDSLIRLHWNPVGFVIALACLSICCLTGGIICIVESGDKRNW